MMKKKIGLIMAAALFAGSVFTGCNPNKYLDLSGVDWTNYTDCSIKVKNSSKYNVVCFKGDADPANLISGCLAGTVTGLKNDPALFSSTSDFVLTVYKQEDYVNCTDLKQIKDKPLCRIYAYYNADSNVRSNNVYEVSGALGGEYYFLLNNTTNYNCEIRKDGLYGEPFCYAGKQTLKTTIYADEGDYDFYPVFRQFDKNSGAILTSYPKTSKGNPMYESIGLGKGQEAAAIDCKDYFTDGFTMSASAVYVTVNNISKTGVKLYQGATAVASKTDIGIETVNSGKPACFTINLEKTTSGESGNTYEAQKKIGGWKVGPEAYKIDVPSITMEAGYRYILDVEGPSYDDIKCSWQIAESDGKDYKAGELVRYKISLEADQ